MRDAVESMIRATAPEAAARALTAMAHRPDSTELLGETRAPDGTRASSSRRAGLPWKSGPTSRVCNYIQEII